MDRGWSEGRSEGCGDGLERGGVVRVWSELCLCVYRAGYAEDSFESTRLVALPRAELAVQPACPKRYSSRATAHCPVAALGRPTHCGEAPPPLQPPVAAHGAALNPCQLSAIECAPVNFQERAKSLPMPGYHRRRLEHCQQPKRSSNQLEATSQKKPAAAAIAQRPALRTAP